MVVLDLSALSGDDTALAVAMTVAGAWLDPAIGARGPRAPDRKRWVIYDEGWRLLRTPAQLKRMQTAWKLARATGTANLLVVHRLSDLDAVGDTGTANRALAEGLLADCSTRILYRQEPDQLDQLARLLGLGAHRVRRRARPPPRHGTVARRNLSPHRGPPPWPAGTHGHVTARFTPSRAYLFRHG